MEKTQIYNFLCSNKEADLYNSFKLAIKLYHPIKANNISIKNTTADGFKTVTKRHEKGSSKSPKIEAFTKFLVAFL